MVDLDGVVDLDLAAPLVQIGVHLFGVDAHGQRPIGGLIHGEVPPARLKDHLGVELSHPQEGDAAGLHLEGGEGTLQPGERALLVGQGIPGVTAVQELALGDQLDDLRLPIVSALNSFDGNDHAFIHWEITSVSTQNSTPRCRRGGRRLLYNKCIPM